MRDLDRQSGTVMLPAMIVITGLLATAIMTASTVQSGVSAAAADRNSMVALHAAESGLAAGRHFLSNNLGWSPLVEVNNLNPGNSLLPLVPNLGITGNTLLPGAAGNPFDANMLAWYEVTILNNLSDATGLLAGTDNDTRVVLRVKGHGPNNSLVVLEVDVTLGSAGIGTPCPAYAQKGLSALGSGFNPCLTTVTGGAVTTFDPNAP